MPRACYITYDMDFRFVPSDLVCCHILISKQDSTIRALRSNRRVTGRRPLDEKHAVRFRQKWENRSQASDTQPIRGVSDEIETGCKRLAPPGTWKKMWEEEVLSLSICLSTHISHTTETLTLSRIKCERYIFL